MKKKKGKSSKNVVKQLLKSLSVHDISFDFSTAKFNVILSDGSKLENVSDIKLTQQYSGTLVTLNIHIDQPKVAQNEKPTI